MAKKGHIYIVYFVGILRHTRYSDLGSFIQNTPLSHIDSEYICLLKCPNDTGSHIQDFVAPSLKRNATIYDFLRYDMSLLPPYRDVILNNSSHYPFNRSEYVFICMFLIFESLY